MKEPGQEIRRGSGKIYAYVGNWTVQFEENAGGIGIYEYCEADGSLAYIDTVRPDITPGMIQVDPQRGTLYAVDEQKDSPAFGMQGGGGRVLAFSINPENGLLTELGEEQPSFGTLPAYTALDGTGRWLVAVNHGDKQAVTKVVCDRDGGYRVTTDFSEVTAALYPVSAGGAVLPACDVHKFKPDRSRIPVCIPCLHAVYFAPDGRHFIVTNMKQDQVLMMQIDREKGKLVICGTLKCPEGSWPRYGAFHPEKNLFYMNYEKALAVSVIRYEEDGKLEIVQTLDATPQLECVKPDRRISQSDLRISADGSRVYDFYRYTDAAAVFSVDPESGLLSMLQSLELKEKRPRGFAISPDGRFLLTANLTGSVATLSIAGDGTLSQTGIAERSMKYPGNITFYRTN